MPFVPLITVIELPKSSSYIRLEDGTATYAAPSTNPTGFGSLGAPVNYAGYIDTRMFVQYLGEAKAEIAQALVVSERDKVVKVNYFLRDGVHTLTRLTGVLCPTTDAAARYVWAVVPDSSGLKLSCTLSGTAGLTYADALGNVTHIRNHGIPDAPLLTVKSLNLTTGIIELTTAYTGAAPVLLAKYYTSCLQVLVLNQGEGSLIHDISTMALTNTQCDHSTSAGLIERVILKMAAQTAFNCGNNVKAHSAALMLSKSNSSTKPCSTCK